VRDVAFAAIAEDEGMHRMRSLDARASACWNWKCALLSAGARSAVYVAALARSRSHGGIAIVAVEIAYVTATAGLYAGMQQRALGLRSRLLGNLVVVLAVPGLAQALDWIAHRALGATPPSRATVVVCVFTLISALFHLHVMRRGVFLTGSAGRTLLNDFRRMPRLVLGFLMLPVTALSGLDSSATGDSGPEAAL
jgi:hypothetical protein